MITIGSCLSLLSDSIHCSAYNVGAMVGTVALSPWSTSMTIHDEAMRIDELAYTLDNISTDDRKAITDYSAADIVAEARYVLELYVNPAQGHINSEALAGDEGAEQQRWARQQVRQLRAFIKKYSK